jgi:hypothetical protein
MNLTENSLKDERKKLSYLCWGQRNTPHTLLDWGGGGVRKLNISPV